MCYSSLVDRALKKAAARHRAKINIDAFVDLYAMGAKDPSLEIPLAMDAGAIDIGGMAGKSIEKYIRDMRGTQLAEQQQLLEDVHAELAEIERQLGIKVLKKYEKDLGVKNRKRDRILQKIAKLTRQHTDDTYRIFPFYFAPVIIDNCGARELVPMRYRILPRTGVEVPTQYNVFNARRDSLQSARNWKPLFGQKHAIFPFYQFYEWVERDGRKLELSFSPDGFADMWAASLYEETKTEHGLIRSFAMVTDEPPPEVAAAGHDRCPVFLREDLIGDWLRPTGKALGELDALLEHKQPTYYSHKLAA